MDVDVTAFVTLLERVGFPVGVSGFLLWFVLGSMAKRLERTEAAIKELTAAVHRGNEIHSEMLRAIRREDAHHV